MNLVLNARDATPPGGRITIRTGTRMIADAEVERERLDHGGEYVWVSVEDTGLRHVERGAGACLRAVLHHQAEGQRHRPRPGHAPTAAWRRAAGSCGVRSELGVGTTMIALLPRSASVMLGAAGAGDPRSRRRRERIRARARGRGRAGGAALRRRRADALRLSDDRGRDADRGARAHGPGRGRPSTCCSPTSCCPR